MKGRILLTSLGSLALFVMAMATLTRAQQPPVPTQASSGADVPHLEAIPSLASDEARKAKLRADVIRSRTEVEMLQLDYDIARSSLMEDVKTLRSLSVAGGVLKLFSAIQSASNDASRPTEALSNSPETPEQRRKNAEEEEKKAKEDEKQAKEEEKQAAAQETALVADRKKELSRLASSLAEKRMDLEDLEADYRKSLR